jgi:hypothetical protein
MGAENVEVDFSEKTEIRGKQPRRKSDKTLFDRQHFPE